MRKRTIATAVAASVVLVSGLSACHGRTNDNVEPNGETIDVVIDTVAADSVVQQ